MKTEEGRAKTHGRVQSAAGVPPSAPGRGNIRREVGRWEASNGAVILQQKEKERGAVLKIVLDCDTGWSVFSTA